MNRKAIALLSGGLDSTLAARMILEQEIEVIALHFTSPFCTCSRLSDGCGIQALKSARELGVEIIVRKKGLEYLKIVEKPKYGYGACLNPCIDCRIFILKKAKEIMVEKGASFIVTGEVVGQRPMSQRKNVLRLIEKEAGLEGLVVRPLSAKVLPPTIPEIEGVIVREKLLGITGRGRKIQYEYARQTGVKEYSCPAGGCLLTDPSFSKRVKDLFTYQKDYTMHDVLLLRIGRHIRINPQQKLIVARNEKENKKLEAMHRSPDVLISPFGFSGPNVILVGEICQEALQIAATVIAHYAKYSGQTIPVKIKADNIWYDAFSKLTFDLEEHII